MTRLKVNDKIHEMDVPAERPLLWVLRNDLGLKGTKYGCGVGVCGSCTVLVDGQAQRSCVLSVQELAGRAVTTIEGLAARGHPVLQAWIDAQVPQCGYCQPAQIMATVALLQRHPQPHDGDIDVALNDILCRCGTYHRIRQAVHRAAAMAVEECKALPPSSPAGDTGVALDEWIRIARDGSVSLTINHSEMGQGVSTSLAMLMAEELEVPFERVRVVYAPADVRYRNPMFDEQTTGGSTSVRGEWQRLSEVGAKARLRLLRAAAQQWRVGEQECVARQGEVIHAASGRRIGYGELAEAAARLPAPAQVELKPVRRTELLGRPLPRLDMPDLVAGRTIYGMDFTLPGLRIAAVARSPQFGAAVVSFDDREARALPGVHDVVQIDSGVAVIAEDLPTALQAREALQVQWQPGSEPQLNNAALDAQLIGALEQPGKVIQERGVWPERVAAGHRTVEAEYRTAPLAHGTIEPGNCTAHVSAKACEVWVGTQSPESARKAAARASGLAEAQVQIHSLNMGGSFGRRIETDLVQEAVALSQRIGAPMQVVCNRADDFQHDFYRPAYRARLRAVLDEKGRPVSWWQRGVGQAVAGQPAVELPYRIAHIQREFVTVESAVPAGAWRAVGPGQDAFAVESFVDELAHAAGVDPYQYRRDLLQHAPRHLAVLDRAAQRIGWEQAPPAGRHRGIAVYHCFGSYVAQAAEVSVQSGEVRVHRVVCAADCGRVVNPDGVRAQLEGGIAMGVSAALKERVLIEGGAVCARTFEDYPILKLSEMPLVEIEIMASDQAPGGAGEPGLPPVAPAVANAIAAATGTRLRALPLQP